MEPTDSQTKPWWLSLLVHQSNNNQGLMWMIVGLNPTKGEIKISDLSLKYGGCIDNDLSLFQGINMWQ